MRMTENTIQTRLERSRRHRSWATARQNVTSGGGGDASTQGGGEVSFGSSIGNPTSTGTGNGNTNSEERTRRQTLHSSNAVRSCISSPYATKAQASESETKDEGQSTPLSPPGICSASSQDSNHTTNSVASRRQRIMALSAKNKSQRRSYNNHNTITSPKVHDTENDVDSIESNNKNNEKAVVVGIKPRSWQSPQSKNPSRFIPPEPIETQCNDIGRVASFAYRSPKTSSSPLASSPCESSLYQSNEMEDYDGKEQPTFSEGPSSSNNKKGISNKRRGFQRDFGMSPSSNNRASPPPPPPSLPDTYNSASQTRDVEHVNKFKSWNEREQRERGHDNGSRVIAFPSPTSWKGSIDSPSSGQPHIRGSRVVVPRSPTASLGSADSSFSAQQPKQQSSTPSKNGANKHGWNSNTRVSKVNGSPDVQRTFSSPKYGSPHTRSFTGSKKSIESQGAMYKNLLKPRQKETSFNQSFEKEAYGAIIETPQKSSVSSLHAMFDSQNAVPLMPMNSTNSSVRQSLPLPIPVTPSSVKTGGSTARYRSSVGRSNVRHSFEEHASSLEAVGLSSNDDRSVTSTRSSSSANRPRHSVVASWSQKNQAEKKYYEQQQKSKNSHPNLPKEDKSRVRQFYNSSWRIESPVQICEKKDLKVATDSSESNEDDFYQETEHGKLNPQKGGDEVKSANLISSWQQKCKPRSIEIDVPDPPISSIDVKGTDIEVNDRKGFEPNTIPPSAVSSFIRSQSKEPDTVDVKGAGIEVKTQKSVEPVAPSPFAVASFMYSQKKISDEVDRKDTGIELKSRKRVGPSAPSPFAVTSFMYPQNKSSDDDHNTLRATMDWPSDTNERNSIQETELEDTVSDIILDSLTEVNPNDFELSPIMNPAPNEDNNSKQLSQKNLQAVLPGVKSSTDTSTHKNSQLPNETTQPPNGTKPWNNDTRSSVVQSWQLRSSKPKGSPPSVPPITGTNGEVSKNATEDVQASNSGDVASGDQIAGNTIGEIDNEIKNQPELLTTNTSSDSFIEEKKSGDLSFDEDKILGQDIDGSKVSVESSQHGDQSNHPRKMPFYDDDSYLSRGDTDTRGLGASESIRTASARSRTSATYNSEDMSIYVEDEQRIISKKEDEILSAQFEHMNLDVVVGESELEVEEKKEEITASALAINLNSNVKANLPRLNPSPKDCDEYRSRFFEDSGVPTAKLTRGIRRRTHEEYRNRHEDVGNKNIIPLMPVSIKNDVDSVQTKKSTENQVFDVWASTSHEERDEAIKFDETEQWLNLDPGIEDSMEADDISVSSEQENFIENCVRDTPNHDPEPRPILIKKPPQSFRSPEKQKQRAKAMSNNTKKARQQLKQDVFDPFGIDVEENGGLRIEISDDLFSSNPDPFTTEESFSPLEWSMSPRGSNTNSNTNKNMTNSQHIGYYNSPDSRVEI